jgi:hypothetical protein
MEENVIDRIFAICETPRAAATGKHYPPPRSKDGETTHTTGPRMLEF